MDGDEPLGVLQFGIWDSEEIPLVTLGSNGDAPIIEIDGLTPPKGPYFVEGVSPTSLARPHSTVTRLPDSIFTPYSAIPASAPLSIVQSDLPNTSGLQPHATETAHANGQGPSQPTHRMSTDWVGTSHQPSDSLRNPSSESTALPKAPVASITSAISSPTSISAVSSSTFVASLTIPSAQPLTPSTLSTLPTLDPSSFSGLVSTTTSSSQGTQSSTPGVLPPPLTGKDANFNVHGAPFYVGIIFATIAGITLLAALIAWWIRLRSHARRRDNFVPWTGLAKDHGGQLEAGQGPYTLEDPDPIFTSREDLAHLQAWNPRGDRDVGEPRHAEPYFGVSGPSGGVASPDRYFHPALRPGTRRQLPAHLIDDTGVAHAMQEIPLDCHNSPLVLGNVGRSNPALSSSQRMVERLRDHRNRRPGSLSEEPGPLPTPGGLTEHHEDVSLEAWSASIKAGLTNAFNAVAANLSSAPRMPRPTDDNLTTLPERMANRRKSVRDGFRRDQTGVDSLIREKSTSTVKSKAWTLEETGKGAGTVHILLKDDPSVPPLSMSSPSAGLSFGDGDRIFRHDGRPLYKTLEARGSGIPLVASSKPQQAHIPPSRRQLSTDTISESSLSRHASVYSMASWKHDTH